MAASAQLASSSVAVSALSSKRSEISVGNVVQALPVLRSATALPPLRLTVVASSKKKFNTKTPYGPSGGTKFKSGADASGSKGKGKGVYQFGGKYGANVDGYSPIFTPSEWAKGGDVYAGGQFGLALWAVTFGALLLVGAFLVYNTSALS